MKTQCTLSGWNVEEEADRNAVVEARKIIGWDNQIIGPACPQRSPHYSGLATSKIHDVVLEWDLTLCTRCSFGKSKLQISRVSEASTFSFPRFHRVTSALYPRILPSMDWINNGARATNRSFVIALIWTICFSSDIRNLSFPLLFYSHFDSNFPSYSI